MSLGCVDHFLEKTNAYQDIDVTGTLMWKYVPQDTGIHFFPPSSYWCSVFEYQWPQFSSDRRPPVVLHLFPRGDDNCRTTLWPRGPCSSGPKPLHSLLREMAQGKTWVLCQYKMPGVMRKSQLRWELMYNNNEEEFVVLWSFRFSSTVPRRLKI